MVAQSVSHALHGHGALLSMDYAGFNKLDSRCAPERATFYLGRHFASP